MNGDFGPGGVFPKKEPPINRFARKPPFETKISNSEPGSFRILQRNEPVVFEAKNTDEPSVVATGNFRRSPGMWVKCEVEDLPCWAIVDTGASTSSSSRHMASLVGKPVNPHPHRLLGPIGNVMPIDGKMLAEVTFGKHKRTNEFIVVDEMYPHVLIRLKFLCDNKCQVDIENETLKNRTRDQAETTVPLYVGDRLEPPTDERACVLQTEDEIEEPVVSNDVLEKNDEDVNEIVELAASDLQDSRIKEKLSSLIGIYRDVFALAKDPLGTAFGTEHSIDTNDNPPFKLAPYKVAPYKLPAVQEEIKEMIDKGVIVPSKSPYSSPIVTVPKKDGTNRMCIDYRRLNEITTKDAFPLPRIGHTIDALQGAGYFSSLDLASGYWQVPVAEKDQHKTTFCTPEGGLYEFVKMPFGLTNAPATFQQLMNEGFKDDLFKHVLIFLDDLLVYSETPAEHLEHLDRVFFKIARGRIEIEAQEVRFVSNSSELSRPCVG